MNNSTLNSSIRRNAIGAYGVKGASMLVGLAAVPAYMRYFNSDAVLGTWYTIQTLLQWVLMFDLGIGNGLRNKMVVAIANNDHKAISEYIVSSGILMGSICVAMTLFMTLLGSVVPWNQFLNISTSSVDANSLKLCMTIVGCGVVLQMFLQLINAILYAMQLSSIVNALALFSNLLVLSFVMIAPVGNDSTNLVLLGIANVICMALPPAIAAIVIFGSGCLGIQVRFTDFNWSRAKESLSTGVVILFLQVAWAVVASTHALLISSFRGPAEVVEYQVYYKVYYTIGSIAAISLVPIWSAVTLAQTERRYSWIISTYFKCMYLGLIVAVICAISAPFMQFGINIWLGDSSIHVNSSYVVIMSLFAVLFVLQNVNSSIGNGLSFFKVQVICMGVAALLMVPVSFLACMLTDSWIGVVLSMIALLIPFQVIEPLSCICHLKKMMCEDGIEGGSE